VCTANICRSPTAETLARRRFGEGRMIFRSAGFLSSGRQCPPELIKVVGEKGVDLASHRSYQLDAPSIQAADLVLTMEGEHVRKAVDAWPEAFPKVMPLTEAAKIVRHLGGGQVGIGDLISHANTVRDPTSYLTSTWDVEDPYKRRLKHYRSAVDEIDGLVDGLFSCVV